MSVRYELFAAGAASPEALWSVVGRPERLAEWTDARLLEASPEPLSTGTMITVEHNGLRLEFTVSTLEDRLVEVLTETAHGPFGLGIRVVRDPLGSRLILAGFHEPRTLLDNWRIRLATAPAVRRRFDTWAERAIALARTEESG